MLSILLHQIRFLNNNQFCVVNGHEKGGSFQCIRFIYSDRDTSSRAYFEYNLMLIKNWIETIPLKLLVFYLWEERITNWLTIIIRNFNLSIIFISNIILIYVQYSCAIMLIFLSNLSASSEDIFIKKLFSI